MPLPAVWGPIAWKLLHGMGARAGKPTIQLQRKDEQRYIVWLINHIEYIIPCNECRAHLQSYRKQEPVPEESSMIGAWLWTFHEAVNERLGKPEGPPFTVELGKSVNILQTWKEYQACVKESFLLGHLRLEDVKEWARILMLWRSCV